MGHALILPPPPKKRHRLSCVAKHLHREKHDELLTLTFRCSDMGMEVRDSCSDKEPDGVVIYSNGASSVLSHESEATHHDNMESLDNRNAFSESCAVREECEVKECTTDALTKVSETTKIENCEEQSYPCISVDDIHSQEAAKAQNMKTKDERKSRVSVKLVSNGRVSCTVPQPFALATEKRASARPSETETDVNRSSQKAKSTPLLNSGKKSQVSFIFFCNVVLLAFQLPFITPQAKQRIF